MDIKYRTEEGLILLEMPPWSAAVLLHMAQLAMKQTVAVHGKESLLGFLSKENGRDIDALIEKLRASYPELYKEGTDFAQ